MQTERLDVNLFERSVIVDPFPLYEEIRSLGPVVRNETLGVWMVTGYDDCMAILSDTGKTFAEMNLEPRVFAPEGRNMIQVDGAEHTRLRRALSPFFTRQATASWERRVDEAVDQVLVPLVEAGSFDIVDFTAIPTIIVAGMMGIPVNRYADFQRWSHLLTSSTSYGNEDSDVGDLIEITGREANDYLREEVAQHAKDMPEDLITVMLRMPDMTEADIRSTAMLLMTAGYDTTAKLITNCLVVLDQYPDVRAALTKDLSLVPAAIEEIFRWVGVVHVVSRQVVRDTVLGDTKLAEGDTMYTLLAAANRDPSRWPEPLRFDITRELKSHLGLGFGPHLCLGAPLARLETKIALERLLTLSPHFKVRDIDYGMGLVVRGPESGFLDVTVPSPT